MDLGDMAKNYAKQQLKSAGKKVAMKIVAAVVGALTSILPYILLAVILIGLFDMVIEIVNGGENTPNAIYTQLEIEDLAELVEIKKNSDKEYYLDFKDDIDSKLDGIIADINSNPATHDIPEDKEFLKKLIKAELVTKFPNLGGDIPEGTSGFQGAATLRRVTPNKDVGEYKNTGRGDTSVEEEEIDFGTVISNEYIENIKKWEDGKQLELVCDAIVYKQRESQINKDKETGYWEPQYEENTKRKIIIEEGTVVTYKGQYRLSTSALTNETTVYVEIESGDIKGYLKSQYLMDKSTEQTSEIDIIKTANSKKYNMSSRAKTEEATKIAGEEGETYTIAIAAGHNNTDDTGASSGGLVEQDLTIEVAEKVEELFAEYSNITVVQTGSTSDNRSGVKVGDRKRLAKAANPDLCIQIHFNAGGGTGVEAIYKTGDGISQQLAEILSKTMSESMGLKDRKAGPDSEKCAIKNLGIIENAATSGFPSVVTEGGFLDGSPDADIIKNQNGVTKYAQGIVNGILEYLVADHSGYSSQAQNNQKTTDTIESVVQNMKYVPEADFDKYIKDNDEKVIGLYTLDKDNKLITATYSNGSFEKNSPTDFSTMLQQYTIPFEYLLYFYIDTDYAEFSKALAEEAMNTEIIMVVQDNISTTKTTKITEQKKHASDSKFSYDWKVVNTETSISEYWSTSVDITYVDTWYVKAYNTISFSTESLGMQNKDKVTINLKGKVTETSSQSETAPVVIESGTASTGKKDSKGKDIMYSYTIYQRTKTTINSLENTYDKGEAKTLGKESKFVKLYNDHQMSKRVRTEGYLFEIIENNEKTANLLNLTKYLIYKATGVDTGVIEYDFSEFELSSFTDIDADYGDWDGTGNQEDFIKAVAPYAVADMETHDIYASVTIAQAIIESGWGKDDIALKYKNFFGMKAFNTTGNEYWSGKRVLLNASEGGQSYFKVYDSLKNSVFDHGRNFHVTATYKTHGVLECMSKNLGPKEQLRRIAISGYAVYQDGSISKPDGVRTYDVYLYDEFIKKYNLEKYDKMKSSDFEAAGGNQEVVKLAKSKLGCAYVFGATGPNTFDCSGLVYWIYQQLGIAVPRATDGYKSYSGSKNEISWDEAKPGDILIVHAEERGTSSGHAGIYLGNDKYIHAPQTGDVVKISEGAKAKFKHVFRFEK